MGLETKVVNGKIYYRDQISPKEIWIYKNKLKKYIFENYGLTEEEYYNLIVFGNKDSYPKCEICGNNRKWYKFSKGYYRTCSNEDCLKKVFAKETIRTNQTTNRSNSGFGSKTKGKLLLMKNELIRCRKILDNSKIYFLYLVESSNGLFKFGLSSDVKARIRKMKYKRLINILDKGSLCYISGLEYEMKMILPDHSEYQQNIETILNAYNSCSSSSMTISKESTSKQMETTSNPLG